MNWRKLGYAVTIFEAQTRPGGLLVNGIPSFKLEKRIVDRRFDLLRRRGVAVRCGVTVGRDIPLSSLRENFDAVYLAIGAQKPKELDIPGADLRGVFHALPFLIQKNLGKRPMNRRSTCAANASRCWAAAIPRWIVCAPRFAAARMKRSAFIDATSKTCPAAGANTLTRPRKAHSSCFSPMPFRCQATPPAKFAKRAVCEWSWANRMRKAVANRARFPAPNSTVPIDVVLIAYGFDPVPIFAAGNSDKIEVNKWSGVIVDENQMTSVPGVFAGGDLVRGPDLVVRAVRDSRKAAAGIHKYLSSQTRV